MSKAWKKGRPSNTTSRAPVGWKSPSFVAPLIINLWPRTCNLGRHHKHALKWGFWRGWLACYSALAFARNLKSGGQSGMPRSTFEQHQLVFVFVYLHLWIMKSLLERVNNFYLLFRLLPLKTRCLDFEQVLAYYSAQVLGSSECSMKFVKRRHPSPWLHADSRRKIRTRCHAPTWKR